jgi:hypothetical protein
MRSPTGQCRQVNQYFAFKTSDYPIRSTASVNYDTRSSAYVFEIPA